MDWIKKNNVGWIDALRIAAIFFVVFSHTCDNFIGEFANDRAAFYWGLFMECIGRPCVVLCVMISGWLLLPIKPGFTISGYWKKRIGRLVPPIIFWSVVLPIVFYVYFQNWGADTHNPCIDAASYTLPNMINHIYTFLFNFSFEATPLWFCFMLIGLYLALPIVNAWLVQASKKELQTVLLLWFGTLFLPYIRAIVPLLGGAGDTGFAPLWGECNWNVFSSLYYMSGFMGYMLLAYYLKTYPLQWSWKKTLAVAIPIYLGGYAVTSFGYVFVDDMFPEEYRFLEIPWWMCGINVAMQAVGVFLVFMKLNIESSERLSKVSTMMFGVFLCHFPIVQIVYDWFYIPALPYAVRIVAVAVTSFAISYLIVRALYSFKLTRRFVK